MAAIGKTEQASLAMSADLSGGKSPPTHELVYRQLRDQILFGEMAPGEAVTIQGLTARLDAGMTPVREALRRLIAEGALVFMGNRRVIVPLLSVANIDELIFARRVLDKQLARLAAKQASKADIVDLERIDALLDAAILRGDVRSYLEHNHLFHQRLNIMADAPILRELSEGLWLRFGPSLRVVCGRIGTQNVPDRHKEAIAALRCGDAEAVACAIEQDVVQGMEVVRQSLMDGQ